MTTEKHSRNGSHLRIYTRDGLTASFNIDMDAVLLAAEIFNTYMVVDK